MKRRVDTPAAPLEYSKLYGVSLFTCAGIGDLGFRKAGVNFIAMNELEPDRSALAKLNFPEARHFSCDVYDVADDICQHVSQALRSDSQELFLVSCTAPCQGMSSGGMGSLLNRIRAGLRAPLDPRNRLILPALKIISELQPLFVVFENVAGMRNTIIEDDAGEMRPILDVIARTLGPRYVGAAYNVEFADYGIPQRRERLITVYTRDPEARARFLRGYALVPPPTHDRRAQHTRERWVSVDSALAGFPPLDAANKRTARCDSMPFHRVPVLDPTKYEWVRRTPLRRSAFDNQCCNPECLYPGNAVHGTKKGHDGINRAVMSTPLYCERCGHLLPRPHTVLPDGTLRIMKGYTSAYKRMPGDLPAPTISRNLSFPCSDQKVHPTENRVLSLAEAMHLQTIDQFEYMWGPLNYLSAAARSVSKDIAPDGLIRLAIAESIPPAFTAILASHLRAMSFGKDETKLGEAIAPPTLFSGTA